ncbi:MAG: hypothetical protein KAI16_02475 [Candidatus Pacebacteria bacterium]|nr:hypothetical protein [Candidatus Paceibacterota bacterium]
MEGNLVKESEKTRTMTLSFEYLGVALRNALVILKVVCYWGQSCHYEPESVDKNNAKKMRDACIIILCCLKKGEVEISSDIEEKIRKTLSNAEGVLNANKEKIKKVA